jgi:hypothetical protein
LFNSVSGANDYVRGLTYDTANSRFVNEGPSGYFEFSASLNIESTNVLVNRYGVRIVNSGSSTIFGPLIVPPSAANQIFTASGQMFVANGQNVEVQLFGSGNNSINTLTLISGTASYFTGRRIPDFTVLGAVRNENQYALSDVKYFTASGTWTKPIGLRAVEVEVVGGGGGGGGAGTTTSTQAAAAGGGSGGGYARSLILAADLPNTVTVTVGAGGSGGSAGPNSGASGGTSSFGSFTSAVGGNGGAGRTGGTNVGASGGSVGTGSVGDFTLTGSAGRAGAVRSGLWSQQGWGGNSFMSRISTEGPTTATVGDNGLAGGPYGGGGSGGYNPPDSAVARSGGNGAVGIVIVREYF